MRKVRVNIGNNESFTVSWGVGVFVFVEKKRLKRQDGLLVLRALSVKFYMQCQLMKEQRQELKISLLGNSCHLLDLRS